MIEDESNNHTLFEHRDCAVNKTRSYKASDYNFNGLAPLQAQSGKRGEKREMKCYVVSQKTITAVSFYDALPFVFVACNKLLSV